MPDIPISAFGDGKGKLRREFAEEVLGSADLIFGKDTRSGNEFLVYGRDLLKSLVRENRSATVRRVDVTLDQSSVELEMLLALVRVIRGRHDYEASPGLPNADDVRATVHPRAKEALTDEEISTAINYALREAVLTEGWRLGKSFTIGFSKNGEQFVVAIDNRVDGLHALVARDGDLEFIPTPNLN